MTKDTLLVLFIVAAVAFLGSTVAFIILWRIAVEDTGAECELCEDVCKDLLNPDEE